MEIWPKAQPDASGRLRFTPLARIQRNAATFFIAGVAITAVGVVDMVKSGGSPSGMARGDLLVGAGILVMVICAIAFLVAVRAAARQSAARNAEFPAGWYPDPRGERASRFWDGKVWTDIASDDPSKGDRSP